MSRHAASSSTQNFSKDVRRQSRLHDSRAHTRLYNCHEDARQSSPASMSLSMEMPSRNEVAAKRPSSAQEFRRTGSLNVQEHRDLVNATHSFFGQNRQSESPDEWFRRIMHAKKLSPLDLCEKFSYGDARRNPLVSLDHVCEVLFALDPEPATGLDPVTEEMEDFLYQFATEQGGEIMVNIREALRSLDIWRIRPLSFATQSSSNTKATDLESENRKLQVLVSSLRDTNLRLSRQMDSVKSALSPKSVEEAISLAWVPTNQANIKAARCEISPDKVIKTSSTESRATSLINGNVSSMSLQIVNDHEQELVEMASKLQFAGVERLNHLLIKNDAESTGFVRVKLLCRLLVDQFELKISEVRLIEMCLGMNFNLKAQLDYKEFVNVLMDILIYALPNIRESEKRKSFLRLDEYLRSGFLLGREKARQVFDTLCSKYDVIGDQCISVADLVRVFQEKLVKHHALKLPFPLEKHEIIQLAQPFIKRRGDDSSSDGSLAYSELLDAILGPLPISESNDSNLKRALNWNFWRNIYMTLCSGNLRVEMKVRAQLEKIMTKLDPNKTFAISSKYFKRIFDRHICSDDTEVLSEALAITNDDKFANGLRYDVLLSLVFDSFKLNDEIYFRNIRDKLLHEQERIVSFINHVLNTQGFSHKLSLQDFHDAFMVPNDEYSLTLTEMLFLFASVESSGNGQVHVKALEEFLSRKCWLDCNFSEKDRNMIAQAAICDDKDNTKMLKTLIAECCSGYDFNRILDKVSRKTQGWISHKDLVKELDKMCHEMGVIGVDQAALHNYVERIAHHSPHISENATACYFRNVIHCDAFFDALFDWDTMVSSMRLPHSLVEVKEVLEKFDKERDGTIRRKDWNKFYQLVSNQNQGLHEWELCVLERRFPGQHYEHTIDYAHLVVYLLDYEQRQARKILQARVYKHFQQLFHCEKTKADIKNLFRAIDMDNKGHFNAADLKTYMTKVFARESEFKHQKDSNTALLSSADAVASVIRLLAETRPVYSCNRSLTGNAEIVVTFERFREFVRSFRADHHKSSAWDSHNESNTMKIHPKLHENVTISMRECRTISSLRSLEMTIMDITRKFIDHEGNILPARAFHYLSLGSAESAHTPRPTRPTRPTSPPRHSTYRDFISRAAHKNQRDLGIPSPAPLTPLRLKRLLFEHHNVKASEHLVSQLFLHIGSPSEQFLDLLHFAQWAAPLSIELQGKIRRLVKQMIAKGKGGGGRIDIERFLAQLQCQLHNSPHYGNTKDVSVQFVPMSLLLSKLHQVNISLDKQEILVLLRHFGQDDDLENIDYASFFHHMYKLSLANDKAKL